MNETININVQGGDDSVAYAGWALLNFLLTELIDKKMLTKDDVGRLYEGSADAIEHSTITGDPTPTSRRAAEMLRHYASVLANPEDK